jgi:predicted RNase H-like HicB family nuclease
VTTVVGESGDGALKLDVDFETDEDGWVVASCPTLPGCHSQGRTRDEALANIREAVEGYLASMGTHGSVGTARRFGLRLLP